MAKKEDKEEEEVVEGEVKQKKQIAWISHFIRGVFFLRN